MFLQNSMMNFRETGYNNSYYHSLTNTTVLRLVSSVPFAIGLTGNRAVLLC